MIEEYRFGVITIDGEIYDYDVEVLWTGEVLGWPMKERHIIDVDEVLEAVEQNPEVIIIGTGEAGMAEVTEAARNFIQEKGIKLIVDKTEQAAKTFNVRKEDSQEELGRQERTIGLFHLTC